MVYAALNDNMISLLKNLKGAKFISYECAKTYNTAYGNLRINTDKGSLELSNIEKTLPFFDIEEDIACFECKISNPNVEFKPYCIEPFGVFKIGETIESIEIINDIVNVNQGEYQISIDRAIIIKTDKGIIMFSRGIWFSEEIGICENDDYDGKYSIDEVIEVWSNQGENIVSVNRTKREI